MVFILLVCLLTGFFLTALFTPITIKFAKRFKLVDDPKIRKHPASIHKTPTPRAGGLPIFLSLLFGAIILLPLNSVFSSILISGFFVVIVGLLDDKYDLSPYLRFLLNTICATIVVYSGASIPFITHPFGGILYFNDFTFTVLNFDVVISPSKLFAISWIVWVMNMLNWSKGVDGQLPGIAAVSAIIIGVTSLRFSILDEMNISTAKMAFIAGGASLGFLVFNFYPARIFPGYSATILGFIIGILSILSSVKLATAVLVMGVPTADAVFTIVRRILSKKSPFWHDKGHLHHLLLSYGYSQKQIAIFYWIVTLVLGIASLTLSSRGKLFAIILVLVLVSGFIFTLKYISRLSQEDEEILK